jgi:hypothetical protein
MAPKEWLVEGIIPVGGLASLVGKQGTFKSFLALDVALSVTTGIPWHGRSVRRGGVVYLATEGSYTIGERHRAWRTAHTTDNTKACKFSISTLNLLQKDHVRLVYEAVKRCTPQVELVVIDTVSRAMGGGDENSPEDMSAFVEACDTIRQQTGACVLVIHHMGLKGDHSRGHTSLPAAVDTEIFTNRTSKTLRLKLTCNKMRQAAEFEPIELIGTEIDSGGESASLVFSVVDKAGTQPGAVTRQQTETREYYRALRFAEQVEEMGNPLAVEIASVRGHKNADKINKYARRVKEEYGLVDIRPERHGKSTVNRLIARLDRKQRLN